MENHKIVLAARKDFESLIYFLYEIYVTPLYSPCEIGFTLRSYLKIIRRRPF